MWASIRIFQGKQQLIVLNIIKYTNINIIQILKLYLDA